METNIDEKLNKLINLLEQINNKQKLINEMNEYTQTEKDGEVTFKFNINDKMVAILPNLSKIMSALEDLQNYRRELYKYDVRGEIFYNKKTKDVKELNDISFEEPLGEGYTTYISVQDVIDKIDDILDGIYTLIDKYWY